jgi:hypothetical protein
MWLYFDELEGSFLQKKKKSVVTSSPSYNRRAMGARTHLGDELVSHVQFFLG